MPYTATNWVMNVTPGNATNLNNLETQYNEAISSFNPKLFTAFVISGLIGSKDGTVVNQLDVTTGTAFLVQTDGTLRQRSLAASTAGQFTTATPSTTYFLDLNPDGTWSWGTSHSAVTNHITICSATTDGSGNILAVTDARPLNTTLFSTMVGALDLPTLVGPLVVDSMNFTGARFNLDNTPVNSEAAGTVNITASAGGSSGLADMKLNVQNDLYLQPSGHVYVAGTKVITLNPTTGAITANGALSTDNATFTTDGSGNVTKVGNITFGIAPTISSLQSGAANGIKMRGWNGTSVTNSLSIGQNVSNTYAVSINSDGALYLGGAQTNSGVILTMQSGASALGFTFKTWNASASVTPFSIGGQFNSALAWVDNSGFFNGPAGGGIPTTRNGTATSVPIFTGSTTPSSPPTGSIWFNV